jgi:tRNA(Ile)-lysidine synthase
MGLMPDQLQVINKLKKTYTGNTCYVACSGGVDSMLLLYLLIQAELNPIALHVNYGLRQEESDLDQALVESFCQEEGIRCEVHRCDLSQYSGNIQLKAREVRYAFFERHLMKDKQSVLFLGHHADDQVETFFINLARNAGMNGLSGMKERSGSFIRPLLSLKKEVIYAWANSKQIPWREDRSNAESKYTRNKLRNIIIPEITHQIPTLGASISFIQDVFQRNYDSNKVKCLPIAQGFLRGNILEIDTWQNLNDPEKLVFLSLIDCKASCLEPIENLIRAQKGGKLILKKDLVIFREASGLVIQTGTQNVLPELIIEKVDTLPAKFTKDIVYLNPTKIHGELKLRQWKIGDRISSLGLKGSQLVSDILSTAKVPSHSKDKVFVVVDDDERILWIPGYKVSRLAIAEDKSAIVKVFLTYKS